LFQALVSLLDFDLMKDEEENLEIIAALQSSEEGRRQYEELCCKREEFANMVCLRFEFSKVQLYKRVTRKNTKNYCILEGKISTTTKISVIFFSKWDFFTPREIFIIARKSIYKSRKGFFWTRDIFAEAKGYVWSNMLSVIVPTFKLL